MKKLLPLIWFCLLCFTEGNAQDLLNVAKEEIKKSKAEYGLTDADFNNWLVTDQYESKKSGLTHIFLRQRYNNIELPDANINIHLNKEGEVIHMRNEFIPNLASRIKINRNSITAIDAIKFSAAAHDLTPKNLKLSHEEEGHELIFNDGDIALEPIKAKLIYHVISKKNIRMAWLVSIYTKDAMHLWQTQVDAVTGEILGESDGVIHCDFGAPHTHCAGEEQAFAHHNTTQNNSFKIGNNPDSYNVFPLGIESPNHGNRAIMTNPADPIASPFGWHDTNGAPGAEFTYTRGNNVLAQEDTNGNDGTGARPDAGPSLDFDYPFDRSWEPNQYQNASITNLFYWNNITHDIWYQYGFDEASGNYQENNYGRGGFGGDYVFADCQDGSGTNNANFNPGTDGTNGRMQMFLWTAGGAFADFLVNTPSNIAKSYGSAAANFGPSSYNLTGDLVIINDGTANASEGCNPAINNLAGKVVLIDRGNCEFGTKCMNAQNAGAIAVVMCNNVAGNPIQMAPGVDGANVTIPAIMISQGDCATIRVETGINVTLSASTLPNQLDGSFDNGIIAHEYGHGISTRLTGGPSINCLNNSEQMGEGWSDFFGLAMTVLPNQTAETARGIGTYATGESTTGGGIRTYPYSRDMAINPHTYASIGGEAVPHGVGSVWCAMIWDMYWDLVDQYGYDNDLYYGTGGNNIAMHLVIEGAKLQGCSPGFVDGRDGILAADQAIYGGANQCIIWNSFARRGLGFSADQGSSGSSTDGSEAFDLPPGLAGVSLTKTANLMEVPEGGNVTFTLTAENLCTDATNVAIVDPLPSQISYINGTASNGGSLVGNTVTYPIQPSLSTGGTLIYTFEASVNAGTYYAPVTLLDDDIESGTGNWLTAGSTGSNWVTNTNNSCGSTTWYAQDITTQSNQFLTLAAPKVLNGLATLEFDHFYDTEATWDGGVVEISTDNGFTWEDLGDSFTANGYNSTIQTNPDSGLSGRKGFTGTSGTCITSRISLCNYIGQTVLIRFYFASDAFEGGDGWYIDRVNFIDEAAFLNVGSVTANGATVESDICIKILEPDPLPIELLSFSATPNERSISLEWITATETNNDGFEITRKSEFESDFTKIGWVEGAGTTNEKQTYTYVDGNVRPNITYYYQLRQVDFDGTMTPTGIESARIINAELSVVTIYPNPVKGGLINIDIMTDQGNDVDITIYNVQGKLMSNKHIPSDELTGTVVMDINHFATGVYVVKVATNGNVAYTDKIIKE